LEWLSKEDDYKPVEDRDAFIDKSILSFVNMLSKIQRSNCSRYSGFIYDINPQLKLVSTLLAVIIVSVSRSFYFLAFACTLVIVQLSFVAKKDVKKILSLDFFVFIFTLVILAPSILGGNMKNSLLILLKTVSTVSFVNILSFTTKWHEVTKSLKLVFIPDLFIFVLDTTIKYIYILGQLSLEMMYSLRLRMIGKNNKKYQALSKIIGNLFIKSMEMGNEMYYAMECRGFNGEYPSAVNMKFTIKDMVYAVFVILLTAAFIILGRK